MTTIIDRMAVELGVERGGFRQGLDAAVRDFDGAAGRIEASGKRMSLSLTRILENGIGYALGNLATKVAALSVSMGKAAMDFESTLAAIKAASGATREEIEALGESARTLGIKYGVGASQAAAATLELVKAGVTTADALNGATEAALIMARATGGTASDGATIAAKAMQSFNLTADDMSSIVQQAAGVINGTTFELQDYALALGQGGKVAAGAGMSFKDFNAAIAAISPAFSSGSDAGTSFKTFLNALTPKTREAADLVKALGLSFYDAEGAMRPIEEIAGQLKDAFGGMADAQKSATVELIFGTDAMRAALALIDAGREGVVKMRDETIASANAQGMATERTKTLSGELERLGAAFGDLGIAIAQTGLIGLLTDVTRIFSGIVQTASGAADAIGEVISQARDFFSGGWAEKLGQALQQFTPGAMYAGSSTPDPGKASGDPNGKPLPGKPKKRIIPGLPGAFGGSSSGPTFSSASSYSLFAQDPAPDKLAFDTEGAKRLSTAVTDIVNRTDEMKRGFERAFEGFTDGITDAIMKAKSFGDVVRGLAGEIARLVIRQSIASPIANFVSKGLGSVFGGFFADGGSPPLGKVSVVGERGPELFVPKGAGTIIPNHAMGGGVSVSYAPMIDARGADAGAVARIEAALRADQASKTAQVTAIVRDGMARRRFRV